MMANRNALCWGRYEAANRQDVTIFTGDVFGRTEILGAGQAADHPHAFLVEQLPHVTLPPHFHLTDQFQVVVAGEGMLGRNHALQAFTVHYARAKTGYGPIQAKGQGLAYLTLRPRVEYGAHYLADPRTVVDRAAPKFQATGGPADFSGQAQAAGVLQTLIAPDVEGPAAWLVRRAPGQALSLPPEARGFGCYQVVAGGSVLAGAECLPPWSCIWHAPQGDELPALQAGPDGADLVVLRFARSSTPA